MILVVVGTESFSFHRLVKAVDELAPEGTLFGQRVFVQAGSSTYTPRACDFERLVSFERMRQLVAAARVVVCHAGAGTTLLALRLGQRPVVVPRRFRHGEHVDDHQVGFARQLAREGLVTAVEDLAHLEEAIRDELERPRGDGSARPPGGVVARLEDLLRGWEAA